MVNIGASGLKDGGQVLDDLVLCLFQLGVETFTSSIERFTVRAPISPSTSCFVFGSMPMDPEQYTVPLATMA